MSNKLIDLIDISKSYGMQTVLDELNLYIRENEFLTLLGPSVCIFDQKCLIHNSSFRQYAAVIV